MSTIKTIDVNVSGLNPNNKYRFKFTNNGGNWPVRVTPLSGVFYPSNVKTYVYFCSTTGECPASDANVFFNTPQTNISDPGLAVGPKSLYSVLGLSITEYDNINEVIYTHPCIVECDECAPQLSIRTDSMSFNPEDGNSTSITSEINGLIPNQSYTYSFEGAGGNWPVKIVPRSGVIKASNEYVNITSLLSFCSSSSVCLEADDKVLNYVDTSNSIDREDRYSVINLVVEPVEKAQSPQASSSSSFSVLCNDCLPKTHVILPSVIDLNAGDTYSSFDVTLDNLIVGQEYSYDFTSVRANWPVLVQPQSGTMMATDKAATIPVKLTLCPSTGLCPSGVNGVLAYTTNVSSDINFGLLDKTARIKLRIKQSSNNESTYSNELSIFCNDCVSKPRASIPNSLNLTQGNDKYVFNADILNLIPNSQYRYVFEAVDANWPVTISPMSGLLTPTTTSMSIPAKLSFCKSTGICPSSDPDVLDYTIDSSCITRAGYISRNIKLRLMIDPINYDAETIYSNELTASCENCLPILDATIPKNLSLNYGTNSIDVLADVSNLVPGTYYSYEFKGAGANWPAILYPMSGVIKANSTFESLTSRLTFCPSTGTCPNGTANVIPYSLDPTCSTNFGAIDRNVKLRLEVKETGCNDSIAQSNECRVSCDNCLKKLEIVQDSNAVLDTFGNNTYVLNSRLNNLIPGETYKYNFARVDSNWPVVVSRQSGEFVATSDSRVVKTDIGFCYPSGSCATDTRDTILVYKENSLYDGSKNKFITLNMSVQQTSCSNTTTYSNDFTLNCNNCLPITDYIVSFSGSPVLTLPVGCCSGTKLLSVNVSNAMPGDNHTYRFISASPAITLTPSSGNIVFQNSGQANLLTVANINLENQSQAVIQFKLTNTSNALEAMDYLAVKCGPECI